MKYISLRHCKKYAAFAVAVVLSAFTPITVNAAEAEDLLIQKEEMEKQEAEALKAQIATTYTMEKKAVITQHVNSLGYWCYRPTESKEEALPLIIYLHGSDGRGSNLDRLLQIEGIPYYINKGYIYPNAIVIAPQCPSGTNWGKLSNDVMTMIAQVIEEENVDTSRISLTGASLGGMGTFSIAINNPTFFSAIVPVCGSVNAANCSVLNDVAVKIFHGTNDYGMGFSVKTAAQVINDNNGNCELIMLQGEGHEIRHVYIDEEYDLINWMISQQRTDVVEETTEEVATEVGVAE